MISSITNITSLSVILPLLIGIFRWQQLTSKTFILFFLYIFTFALIEIGSVYLATHGKSNHWCYNSLILFTAIYLSLIFYSVFAKKIILFLGGLLFIFLISNFIVNNYTIFNPINYIVLFIYQGIGSGIFIGKMLSDTNKSSLQSAHFWMFSGMFLYAFGTIFLYFFWDKIVSHQNATISLFYHLFNLGINILINSFYAISFLCNKKI